MSMDISAYKHKVWLAESNYDALLERSKHESDGFSETLLLTEEQFKKREAIYLDSINNFLNERIKLKNLLRDTRFNVRKDTIYRTLSVDTTIVSDTLFVGKYIKVMDSCLVVSVYEPQGSDSAYVKTQLNIKGSVLIYKGKRTQQASLFGLNIFRYGPRSINAKMITNCNNASITIDDAQLAK